MRRRIARQVGRRIGLRPALQLGHGPRHGQRCQHSVFARVQIAFPRGHADELTAPPRSGVVENPTGRRFRLGGKRASSRTSMDCQAKERSCSAAEHARKRDAPCLIASERWTDRGVRPDRDLARELGANRSRSPGPAGWPSVGQVSRRRGDYPSRRATRCLRPRPRSSFLLRQENATLLPMTAMAKSLGIILG